METAQLNLKSSNTNSLHHHHPQFFRLQMIVELLLCHGLNKTAWVTQSAHTRFQWEIPSANHLLWTTLFLQAPTHLLCKTSTISHLLLEKPITSVSQLLAIFALDLLQMKSLSLLVAQYLLQQMYVYQFQETRHVLLGLHHKAHNSLVSLDTKLRFHTMLPTINSSQATHKTGLLLPAPITIM